MREKESRTPARGAQGGGRQGGGGVAATEGEDCGDHARIGGDALVHSLRVGELVAADEAAVAEDQHALALRGRNAQLRADPRQLRRPNAAAAADKNAVGDTGGRRRREATRGIVGVENEDAPAGGGEKGVVGSRLRARVRERRTDAVRSEAACIASTGSNVPGGARELAAHVVEGLQRRPLSVDVGVLRGQHVAQVHYHRHAPAPEVLDSPLQALERMPKIAGSPSEDVVGEVGVLRAADDADAKEA